MDIYQTPSVPKANNRRDSASEQIKHYIRARKLKPGELLPPVRALSKHFGYSRDATWRALQTLRKQKWIKAKANRRYIIAEEVYSEILRSIKIHALFCGHNYIEFTGFRRLVDQLKKECAYHNLDLKITLCPRGEVLPNSIWENSEILLVDSDSSTQLLKDHKDFPIPVIGLDADFSDQYRANIVTDHLMGGRIAAERLIKRGTKRASVCYFSGSENNPRVKPRIDGFCQAWLESGRSKKDLKIISFKWSSSRFEIALKVHEYLKNNPIDCDLFITDGKLATTYLEVLDYLKVNVPKELRLIGYDGSQLGGTTNPPMTTIQQDMSKIATCSVKLITEDIYTNKVSNEIIRIAPTFIARDSD